MKLVDALTLIASEDAYIRDEDGGYSLGELVDANFSPGRCITASRHVRDRLRELGVDAWLTNEDHPLNTLPPTTSGHELHQLGIKPLRSGYKYHVAACAVDERGAIYLIDYTATQYNITQWPLIIEL